MSHLSHGLHDSSKIRKIWEGFQRDIYSFLKNAWPPPVKWTELMTLHFRRYGKNELHKANYWWMWLKNEGCNGISRLRIGHLAVISHCSTNPHTIHRAPPSYMSSQLLCGMMDAHPVTFCWSPHFSPAIIFPSISMTLVSPSIVAQNSLI